MAKGRFVLTSRLSYIIAVVLLLLAAFFRITDLATLPPGLSDNEITNARFVDNVKQGDISVFYNYENAGREGLYHVVVALITAFTGEGTIGYRILSVWLGVLSIAMVYTLARHLFNPTVAVLSAGLLAFNMTSILLARTVSSDALLIFLSSATMLALARSLPIYRTTRIVTANTTAFASLGVVLGLSFYVHPASLMIVLGSMVFLVYLVFIRQAMSPQRRSYTGFALLVMLIITMPYLISTINRPELAAGQRIFSDYSGGIIYSTLVGLQGIVLNGDMNPLHNLPGRPLVDAFSGLLMLVGFVAALFRWREPRFMLPTIMFIFVLPTAVIVPDSPNFSQFGGILPSLVLLFSVGVYSIFRLQIFRDAVFRRMATVAVIALILFNGLWTWQDLFVWRADEDVMAAFNGELGQIAHHLDVTGGEMLTVLCNPDWAMETSPLDLNDSDTMLFMMNRSQFDYREADCTQSLVLTEGGADEQIVLFRDETRDAMYPYLQMWLESGNYVTEDVPRDTIIQLETSDRLADTAGAFITTSPVAYAPETADVIEPVSPPIRFGGNLTFLGYEPNVERTYMPGDVVDIITYWRVEGLIPRDLTLFTHILTDPVTLFANRDGISVNPYRLRERDVFIQVTQIEIPPTSLPTEYFISVGAYTETVDDRLDVFRDDVPYGNRIFLYTINVLPPPEAEEGTD
jgi:4-amino-4-deoxy-L-arabinose transferase-like glycosyltransferase